MERNNTAWALRSKINVFIYQLKMLIINHAGLQTSGSIAYGGDQRRL
jgi:hypothetical protein